MPARLAPTGGAFSALSAAVSCVLGTNTANGFTLTINGANGTLRSMALLSGGSKRWELGLTGNETGSNVGSDLILNAFADDGTTVTGGGFYGHRTSGSLSIGYADIGAATINSSPVGNQTPSTGAFTSLSASGAVSGAGFVAFHAAPGPIGSTTPSTGAFTTLTAATPAPGDSSSNVATTAAVNLAVDGIVTVSTTGGTTTLTAAQYAAGATIVTGALTSNAILVVPNAGIFTIFNRTTGAFTLTIKTAAGAGVTVSQGYSDYMIADGTNIAMGNSDLSGSALINGTVNGSPVGATTPATGAFTSLSATGTVSGAGFVSLFASAPAIGSTTPNSGVFTSILSTSYAMNAAAGTVRGFYWQSGFSARVSMQVDGSAETGSNAGSNFQFNVFSDTGALLSSPINITRATGLVAMGNVAISGGNVNATAVGTTTQAAGGFTSLSASGTVSGAGIVALHASPGPLGSTTPSTGAFTTLSASSTVSGVGFSNYLASPPAIGGTAPSTGVFTNLSSTSYQYSSGANALTAAGTTQATGYVINRSISIFTTVASGAGATLPNVPPQTLISTVMAEFTIVNAGANALLLYPFSGSSINALAANAALSVAAGAIVRGFQNTSTTYRFG